MQTFNCTKLYLLGFCVDHPKCCIYTNKIGRIRTMGGMVCTAIEIPRQSINFNSMKDRWFFFSIHLSVSTHLFFWAIRTQQKSDKNVYLFHCCRGGSEFQSLFLSLFLFLSRMWHNSSLNHSMQPTFWALHNNRTVEGHTSKRSRKM